MYKILGAAMVAVVLAIPAAHAAQAFYVGANVALGKGEATISNGVTTLQSTNDPRPVGIRLGYQINRTFAVEAGYTNFGEYDFANSARLDMSSTQLALKGTFPVSQNWALTGRIGAVRHDVETSQPGVPSEDASKTLRLLSFGAEYRFTEQLTGTLDLVDYGTTRTERLNLRIHQLEIGFNYKF